MKYSELILKGKEALDAIKAPFIARKAHKDLEMKMLEIEQKLAEADVTIDECKSKNPAEWEKIIDAINSKELLNRKLNQYKALEKELF
jgi:hypothetical protein